MTKYIHRLNRAPQPTLQDPYAQIKWAFFQIETEKNEFTAPNFRYAKNIYIRFVSETHAYYSELKHNPRFYLDKYWESDALIRFIKWLSDQDLKSKTKYSIYKSVRQVMDMAYALCTIDSIIYHAPMFKGVSETKQRAAYNKREQEIINTAITRWITLGINVLNGYTPTGQGIPFREQNLTPTITVDGETFSIEDAEKIFAVPKKTILRRIRRGWTVHQALGLYTQKKLVVNGITYNSVSLAANAFKLNSELVSKRLRMGWTPEQALGIELRERHKVGQPKELEVEDIKYKSIKQAAAAYGLDFRLVNHRLLNGWSPRQALELDPREPVAKSLVVEGVKYESLSQAAKAYDINHEKISYRLARGYTPEQAVGIIPKYVHKTDDRAILWMFENTYNCDPRAMLTAFLPTNNNDQRISIDRILSLFMKWGVWPYIDAKLIMPLAAALTMLTGLNVESLKSLELDSYMPEHPLTGQPVIRYHKKRSGSSHRSEDKELHIPILEIEELYVDDSVAEKIHTIILIVKELTASIRPSAPQEIANRLFIFEDVDKTGSGGSGAIVAIDPKRKAGKWLNKFAREEGLYNIFGNGFNFNIARCRPTLATNMILAGADLFLVQTALGHQSVQTTAQYLDELQLQPLFNKTVSEALEKICQRSQNVEDNQNQQTNLISNNPEYLMEKFHETLSGCGCKNAYNPSDNVRRVTNFKEGAVCKYWNMCLLCDNSIITQNSLPKLINYRAKISQALATRSPSIQSRTKLFEDTAKLIQGILEPGIIFPKDVIENAHYIAKCQDDLLLDQLVYQGI